MQNVLIIGDSQFVINRDRTLQDDDASPSENIWIWLQSILKKFQSIEMYHVLRGLNYEVDEYANR